jgi:hypothetical protein
MKALAMSSLGGMFSAICGCHIYSTFCSAEEYTLSVSHRAILSFKNQQKDFCLPLRWGYSVAGGL